MEGMKLYSMLGAKKTNKVGNDMWKQISASGKIPERSADSLKAFWKKYSQRQLEEYLIESIFFKTDFCLSFKEFPNEDFVESKNWQDPTSILSHAFLLFPDKTFSCLGMFKLAHFVRAA